MPPGSNHFKQPPGPGEPQRIAFSPSREAASPRIQGNQPGRPPEVSPAQVAAEMAAARRIAGEGPQPMASPPLPLPPSPAERKPASPLAQIAPEKLRSAKVAVPQTDMVRSLRQRLGLVPEKYPEREVLGILWKFRPIANDETAQSIRVALQFPPSEQEVQMRCALLAWAVAAIDGVPVWRFFGLEVPSPDVMFHELQPPDQMREACWSFLFTMLMHEFTGNQLDSLYEAWEEAIDGKIKTIDLLELRKRIEEAFDTYERDRDAIPEGGHKRHLVALIVGELLENRDSWFRIAHGAKLLNEEHIPVPFEIKRTSTSPSSDTSAPPSDDSPTSPESSG